MSESPTRPEPGEARDPLLPFLHIRPAAGWLNDPNGLCLIDGRYHVFFQHNPDAPVHGDVAWGHVSSTDLLSWREHPVALRPRAGLIDAAGCWSGCVVDDAGTPTAVYTANPDHAWNGAVTLARSDRTLDRWVQDERPVQGPPEVGEARDPFVFRYQGHRYAVQGAGSPHGEPQLRLYNCDDLAHWTELGPLLGVDDPVAAEFCDANIWECPNLVPVGDRWVLVLSLWRWRDRAHELAGVRYLVGDLETRERGLRFVATSGGVLDDGPAYYAPQLLSTADRVLLWGWSWEIGRSAEEVAAAGWAGVLTFPRELGLVDEELRIVPAAELVGLRGERLEATAAVIELGLGAYEMVAYGDVSVALYEPATDTEEVVVEVLGSPESPAQVFLDGSLIEAYAAGRTYTTRAYPSAASRWRVEGSPELIVYPLRLPTDG